MTEKAYTWQFILSNIRHKNSYATGNYVAGGPRMPVVEKTRLGLDVNTRCFRRPTTAETDTEVGEALRLGTTPDRSRAEVS